MEASFQACKGGGGGVGGGRGEGGGEGGGNCNQKAGRDEKCSYHRRPERWSARASRGGFYRVPNALRLDSIGE